MGSLYAAVTDCLAKLYRGEIAMEEFICVAKTSDLLEGTGKLVEVGGKRIALFYDGNDYRAIEDECPHRGGPLSDGEINGNEVSCPWHGARFDIRDGKALSPPAPSNVTAYPVRVDGENIEISINNDC